MKRGDLTQEALRKAYEVLLERFGEPIGDAVDAGPGVADERGGKPHKGKAPGNSGWGSQLQEDIGEGEVNNTVCQACGGMMTMQGDTCTQCGSMGAMEESERGGRHPGHTSSCTCPDCQPNHVDGIRESRYEVTPQEVLTTWEDLQLSSMQNRRKGDPNGITPGVVSLEELCSWLSAPEAHIRRALPKVGLLVDRNGNVVERGLTPKPFPAIKR